MSFFRHIFLIINYKTLIITILALLATWYCRVNGYYADFPVMLISIAIIFPVVFAINSAYDRRERGLQSLAQCKGYLLGYYRIAIDQPKTPSNEESKKIYDQIVTTFETMKLFLESTNEEGRVHEKKIYSLVKELSMSSKKLREYGLQGRFVSRMSEHLTRFNVAFEDMKMIFYYRTPHAIRAYGRLFIYAFPILYAPYFAFLTTDYSSGIPLPFYYMVPVLYTFILSSLENIQTQLENPYDQIGEDDISIDLKSIEQMVEE